MISACKNLLPDTYISHICISDIKIGRDKNKFHLCVCQIPIPAMSMFNKK